MTTNTAAAVEPSAATTTTITTPEEKPAVVSENGPVGCYLVYDPSSSGRLMLYYSKGPVPENAVGFWCPGEGQQIQAFKFKQDCGRSELITGIAGGDANRRKYFVGWCQFVKLAKAKQGKVIQFCPEGQGVQVDVYGYVQSKHQPEFLPLDQGLVDILAYDAIAVMPRHHEFLEGVKTTDLQNFMVMGNLAGASTTMM